MTKFSKINTKFINLSRNKKVLRTKIKKIILLESKDEEKIY